MAKNARRRHDRARWIARRMSILRNGIYFAESKEGDPWPEHPGEVADQLFACACWMCRGQRDRDRPRLRRWSKDIDD